MLRIITVIAITLLAAVPAFAEEYLATLAVDGRAIGQYLLDDNSGKLTVDKAAMAAIGFNVGNVNNAMVPVSMLEKSGKIDWNAQKQILNFEPENPEYFRAAAAKNAAKPDKIITPKPALDLKALDYQISDIMSNRSNNAYSLSGNFIGRLYYTDLELHLDGGSGSSTWQNSLVGEWRDEKNEYVKSARFGKIDTYNGAALSNEPFSRFGAFGSDAYTVYFPIGSRLDIYRNGLFVGTATTTSSGYDIKLDLQYGSNDYKIIAYCPDGSVRETKFRKSIDSYLADKGKVRYTIGGGAEPDNHGDGAYIARLSYGVLSNTTIEAEATRSGSVEAQKLTLYSRISEELFLTASAENNGFNVQVQGSKGIIDGNINVGRDPSGDYINGGLTVGVWGNPYLYASHTQNNDRVRVMGNISVPVLTCHATLIPSVEFEHDKTTGLDTRRASLMGICPVQQLARVQASWAGEWNPETNNSTYQFDVIRDIPDFGNITLSSTLSRSIDRSMHVETLEGKLNFQSWQYASITLDITNRPTQGDTSAMLMLTGSLTRHGATRDQQAQRATVFVSACVDKAGAGKCDDNSESVDTEIVIDGSTKKLPVLLSDIVPYRPYTIKVLDAVGLVAESHTIEFTGNRGQITSVQIPFAELTDLDGYVAPRRDGVTVKLLLDGKDYLTTTTAFGGYWYFSIPSNLKSRVAISY
ncbi:hypothetical protein [Oryzomonas rubra]|uniref:Outer membrane usher protein FimD/PapC n=1 Tax=Oryzomonas rubra TaxID=2509454 RepID=A0A5A9X5Z8_9BACT|nr:hypothetical protein [Oryzomonas rubra]KAA0888083.1 hypothetical protein ET418_16925 [Oryzomonas rubra]